MFIRVRLLKGFSEPLFYKVPKSFKTSPDPGTIVTVPIKNILSPALVLDNYSTIPFSPNFVIKEYKSIEKIPSDHLYHSFIKKISAFYFTPSLLFYKRIRTFIYTKEKQSEQFYKEIIDKKTHSILLTKEQQAIVTAIQKDLLEKKFPPSLSESSKMTPTMSADLHNYSNNLLLQQ